MPILMMKTLKLLTDQSMDVASKIYRQLAIIIATTIANLHH